MLKLDKTLTEEDTKKLFQKFDLNNDGKIVQAEFFNALISH